MRSEADGGRAGYDLGALFEEHVADEFDLHDVDATMATMTAEPYAGVPSLPKNALIPD
jgi:hypothetical protein